MEAIESLRRVLTRQDGWWRRLIVCWKIENKSHWNADQKWKFSEYFSYFLVGRSWSFFSFSFICICFDAKFKISVKFILHCHFLWPRKKKLKKKIGTVKMKNICRRWQEKIGVMNISCGAYGVSGKTRKNLGIETNKLKGERSGSGRY